MDDLYDLYHFLFETYAGLGILMLAGLVISFLAAFIMEGRFRKQFVSQPEEDEDDEWSMFDEDEDEDDFDE